MPPLHYIPALRTADNVGGGRLTAGGGVLAAGGGRGVGGGVFAPPTGRKGLDIRENGARGAGGRKARFCPEEGQGRAFCVCIRIVS